jgi:hypothetical protein
MLVPNSEQIKEIENDLSQMRENAIRIAAQWNETPLAELNQVADTIAPLLDWSQRLRIAHQITGN